MNDQLKDKFLNAIEIAKKIEGVNDNEFIIHLYGSNSLSIKLHIENFVAVGDICINNIPYHTSFKLNKNAKLCFNAVRDAYFQYRQREREAEKKIITNVFNSL